MNLIKCYMTQSTWYKGAGNRTLRGVLWHSTGCENTTIKRYVQPDDNAPDKDQLIAIIGKNKYGNDWNHQYREAGVNAWIGTIADGSVATVQVGPWEKKTWGCGDISSRLKNGWSLNETHVQFEICEDGLNNETYFKKVYKEACELTAMLCKQYNLDPCGTFIYKGENIPVLTDHAGSHAIGHGGDHGDVGHWFKRYLGNNYMDIIRQDVKKIMDGDKPQPEPKPETVKEGDLVSIKADATYYKGQAIPKWVKNQNWYVLQIRGDRAVINENEAKTNAICSPINIKYLVKVAKPEPKPAYRTYTIQAGDTLWGIARKLLGNGHRYVEIKELNNMKSDLIHAGTVLKIPNK